MDKLKMLRKLIDDIDNQLLDLVKSRMDVVVEIGNVKTENNVEVVDKEREEQIYVRLLAKAKEKGVKPEVVKKVWKSLLEISYEIEGGKNGKS